MQIIAGFLQAKMLQDHYETLNRKMVKQERNFQKYRKKACVRIRSKYFDFLDFSYWSMNWISFAKVLNVKGRKGCTY